MACFESLFPFGISLDKLIRNFKKNVLQTLKIGDYTMTLIKLKPSTTATPGFSNLLDHFFDKELMPLYESEFRRSVPAINIYENNEGFNIDIAAPGMKREDFKISLEKNSLTIKAEKSNECKAEDVQYSKREFCYCQFERTFTLPETADNERIDAEYKDGILNIFSTIKEEAQEKPGRDINIH
ncbi:MAG: Hsp20/alpha crystallin family protein [Bacteroidota bacterium]